MPTTQTWTGSGGDGTWGNSANWSTGTLPSTLDGVVFSSGPAATLTTSSGLVKIASLTMNSPAASLTVQGSLTVGAAHLNMVPNFIDSSQGSLIVDGGSLTAGQYVTSATGNVQLTNGGTYLWQGTGVSTQTIDMGDSINDSFVFTQQFGGTIQNFHAGQFISYSGGVNSVSVGTNTITFNASNGSTYTINLTGNYDSSNLIVSGNSVYTTVPVCFVSGSLIRTVRGDVPVETLRVGDIVITASGEQQPIVWLGNRTLKFDLSNEQRYEDAWPIKVQAGAFGPDQPYSDLWLSPGHSVGLNVIDDIFIPVGHLTNGATIAQMEVDQVTYWHVELENHDTLIANGLDAESYYDSGNRAWFKNKSDSSNPDLKYGVLSRDYGRPVIQGGAILEAVRTQLRTRAEKLGWVRSEDLDIHLMINGERVNPEIDGHVAQFLIPANATDVVLMSNTFVPAEWSATNQGDRRQLGLYVKSFHIHGMKGSQDVAVDDPCFSSGFHIPEVTTDGSSQRWTNGRLPMPSQLWSANAAFFSVLRVTMKSVSHPCWLKSPEAIQVKQPPSLTLRTVA
ncbi:Hint domain-containing protein [Aquirhabdus parva]|uniref:Hedgehog/Intein (Hint) domain-containing protein n=1 Tax=Aquirhabdus parva TaxID=2283318 RepID=A0A345P965_9GAMM|nr:Hint domain-containing protein [Aquirhabdus parva]AXI03824.1 hypothetical protein HYN46_13870 [Aquirhabdus parva]